MMRFTAISIMYFSLLMKGGESFRSGRGKSDDRRERRRNLGMKRKHKMKKTSSSSYSSSPKSTKSNRDEELAGCTSEIAEEILDQVPEAITKNPPGCCGYGGPTAVIVTQATRNDDTTSGFDPAWDGFYIHFLEASYLSGTCFVMTGYDPSEDSGRTLSSIMIDINTAASNIDEVPAIMTTDPTENFMLINAVRTISDEAGGPSIGVFNTGNAKVVVESLLSGKDRLPYIGNTDERNYGTLAAEASLDLLGVPTANPLCLNAQPGLNAVGIRCAGFYESMTTEDIQPQFGVACDTANVTELAKTITETNVDAVFAQSECCSVAAQAVEMAVGSSTGRQIVVGCMDEDTTGGNIDFVTKQPLELQAFQTYNFVQFPLRQSLEGVNGRNQQFFPSLSTQVRTDVFNVIVD